jgi:hypothetical protein
MQQHGFVHGGVLSYLDPAARTAGELSDHQADVR